MARNDPKIYAWRGKKRKKQKTGETPLCINRKFG